MEMISVPDSVPVVWDVTPGMWLRWREGVKPHCPCPASAVLDLNDGVETGEQVPTFFFHEPVCEGTRVCASSSLSCFRWGLAPGEEAQGEL